MLSKTKSRLSADKAGFAGKNYKFLKEANQPAPMKRRRGEPSAE
jgi:hypothetical protein